MSGQPYAGDIPEPYFGGDATDREPIIVSWLPTTHPLAAHAEDRRDDDADLRDAMRYFQRRTTEGNS